MFQTGRKVAQISEFIDRLTHANYNNQEREFDVPTVIYAHKEIESIETDGEYEIVSLGKNGGSRIEIRTNIGNHKVTVKLK